MITDDEMEEIVRPWRQRCAQLELENRRLMQALGNFAALLPPAPIVLAGYAFSVNPACPKDEIQIEQGEKIIATIKLAEGG